MYLGENIKKLGFGLMRLPMLGNEVDLEQTKQMVDLFLQKGFTYFDTAFGYLDGKSEAAIKLALVDRYPRDKFLLATKLPAWSGVKTTAAAQQQFFTSLERTGAGYFDFYLLHNLGDSRTQTFDDFQIWDFLAEQKKKGLIRHLGFSIHDTADKLEEVLTKHPEMEFVQ
ncbi:MAG: aldo/keto reductase, partial [Oscillospiraceae bacterium]